MDETLVAIVNLCMTISKKSYNIYTHLSKWVGDEKLKGFWASMAREEREHTRYWEELQDGAQTGRTAHALDSPHELKRKLQSLVSKIVPLESESSRIRNDIVRAFLIAFRLEFYSLHPAMASILCSLEPFTAARTPLDAYDDHISKLANFCTEYCGGNPAIGLLGETLYALWQDRSSMALQNSTDALTGVLNRGSLLRVLTVLAHLAHRNQYTLGVLVLGIDNFRHLNEAHGNEAGDRALQFVADCIRSRMRDSDVLGRYGGDEFLVGLSRVDPSCISAVADEIRSRIDTESQQEVPVTVSVGACYGVPEADAENSLRDLIRRADKSLYQAKRSGRNRVECCGA